MYLNTKYIRFFLKEFQYELVFCISNTFNLSIFVFSKYIKYFLPINLFIRLISCIN